MTASAGSTVVVVGGGIAGVAAAWFLRGAGLHVTVLESATALGGKLRLSEVAGVPVDDGAESVLARRPEAVDLVRAVGLGGDLVFPMTTSAAVWSRGALRNLPAGSVMGVPADLRALARSGLLTRRELARVCLDLVLPGSPVDDDVAVGPLVRRRLGRAVADRIVDPLLGGVYAGPADGLSLDTTVPALGAQARRTRSLLRAAHQARPAASSGPVFASLAGGLGRLPAAVAVASGATVRTGATVRELSRMPSGWRLVLGPTAAPEAVEADAVVLAVPGAPARRLLADVAPAAAAELAGLDYASVAIVTLVLPPTALPPGSGLLVPAGERRTVKAVTFSSAKWGWYAERHPGVTVVRASVGRYGEERDLQRGDEELVRLVRDDLAAVAGVTAVPLGARVTRWGGALPQYAPGHLDRVARLRAALEGEPTLAVCGAAYDGVGVPAVVASAEQAAARVRAALATGRQCLA